MKSVFCLFFFFSSRRRHTRSKRDWSSDVCSSDLAGLHIALLSGWPLQAVAMLHLKSLWALAKGLLKATRKCRREAVAKNSRSEERRVEKECRTRWETNQ